MKVVVIDDDPTGSQTVHSCPLMMKWDVPLLRRGLRNPSPIFFILASINGLFIGPIQSASRVFITKSIDQNNQATGFGLFALSGKLTSFIGPLLVGSITFISNSQRIGFSSAVVLLILGLIILINVKKI